MRRFYEDLWKIEYDVTFRAWPCPSCESGTLEHKGAKYMVVEEKRSRASSTTGLPRIQTATSLSSALRAEVTFPKYFCAISISLTL